MKDSGAFAQFAGISMTVANGQVSDVKIGGKAMDMSKSYRFTIPSFNAAGGDGYPKIMEHASFVNTGYVDAEVLKEYIEANSPINVADFEPKNDMVYN